MNKTHAIILGAIVLLLLTGCAGPNPLQNTATSTGYSAGFLDGIWNGFTAIPCFAWSLFNPAIHFYEVHNNGGWYNWGFLIGAGAFSGGAAKSSSSQQA